MHAAHDAKLHLTGPQLPAALPPILSESWHEHLTAVCLPSIACLDMQGTTDACRFVLTESLSGLQASGHDGVRLSNLRIANRRSVLDAYYVPCAATYSGAPLALASSSFIFAVAALPQQVATSCIRLGHEQSADQQLSAHKLVPRLHVRHLSLHLT